MKFNISRRDLLKIAGVSSAGVLAVGSAGVGTGCTTATGSANDSCKDITQQVAYNSKNLPMLYDVDVCVIGGGPSGVAAAVSSGKNGAKTLLVERGIQLGGLQTMGDVIPCMNPLCDGADTPFITDFKKRLTDKGLNWNDHQKANEDTIWTNPEVLSLVYDEMCEDANVDVLYNCVYVDSIMEHKKLSKIIVQTIAGLCAIKAKTFIDCSGDAIVSRTSGVPSEHGYEKTGNNQPMSFRFEIGGVDLDKVYQYITVELKDTFCATKPPHYEFAETLENNKFALQPLMKQGIADGEITEQDAKYIQAFAIVNKPGCMSMNCPELPVSFSASDPKSYAKGVVEGRKMINRLVSYFVKHIPGFENAYLAKEASMLGARESFRIKGKYYLVEDDYHNQARFDDAVARTGYYIDTHGEKVSEPLPKGAYYEIPYRSLVADEVSNLIVAGRCISASFVMQASMRIQLTCMSIGEAAGIAASWGVQNNCDANNVNWAELPSDIKSYTSS